MNNNSISTKPQNKNQLRQIPRITGLSSFKAEESTHEYGRHSHAEYAIGVIEAGVSGNEVKGTTYYHPAGSLVLMNPDTVHTGYAVDNNPISYRMFYLDAALYQNLLPDKSHLPYFSDVVVYHPDWGKQLSRLHSQLNSNLDHLCQETALVETFAKLAHHFGRTAPIKNGREPEAIQQIKAYLHAHYQNNISIDELAELTHLNRAYMIRSFRKSVGMPPYTYLLQIRIEEAKKQLSAGHSIADVAQMVGFVDQSHFTRRFKNIVGTTPYQFVRGQNL